MTEDRVIDDVISLAGASVVVTGASGGIGAAIARGFAAAGAQVVVHYHRDAAAGRGLAAEIDGQAVGGDIVDAAVGRALVAAAVDRCAEQNTEPIPLIDAGS